MPLKQYFLLLLIGLRIIKFYPFIKLCVFKLSALLIM